MNRYTAGLKARRDIKDIYKHVARDYLPAADRLYDTFTACFRMLAHRPLLGEARPDLDKDIRVFSVGNYVVLYRPARHGISIARVVHGARDLPEVWRRG
jgi:toxin ParE1/3/4